MNKEKSSEYCQYSKCKAVAEYSTNLGNYCPYHKKVLAKKKDITATKIEISPAVKNLLKKVRSNPLYSVKLKGGKNKT